MRLNKLYFGVFMVFFLLAGLGLAQAANILIVAGTDALAQTAATVLNADLVGANTVTIVNGPVPVSLAGFTQIYDVRFSNAPAFTPGEMTQYLTFLNTAPNNAIFLIGENAGFNARNGPVDTFIALAGAGTIADPIISTTSSETVAVLFRTPNAISTVTFAAAGLVASSGTGQFASHEATGGGSLFFGIGALPNAPTGALAVVYDVNFIATAPSGGAVNEVAFRQNLEQFLSAPPLAPPVPTLGTWGQILLAMIVLGSGVIFLRRRSHSAMGS
jgi:hypothetical protein